MKNSKMHTILVRVNYFYLTKFYIVLLSFFFKCYKIELTFKNEIGNENNFESILTT